MKILIASDIHGSAYYCSALLERFEDEKADYLVLLGDILYHGPRNDLPRDYAPKRVIDMLNGVADKIIAVRGNCDTEVDQMVLKFPLLAEYSHLLVSERLIYLTHGHHLDSLLTLLKSGSATVFYGHTHIPEYRKEGSVTVINTGSVSIPKENSRNSYVLIENDKVLWKDVTNGEIYKEIMLL